MLTANKKTLVKISEKLLEEEVIFEDTFQQLLSPEQ